MSHVATVDVEIKDLAALVEACKTLGLELIEGQQTYRWFGKHVGDYPLPAGFKKDELGKCEHAIRIAGVVAEGPCTPDNTRPYEIGVVKRRDGRPGYSLLWDFFDGGYGLQKHVGKDCVDLRKAYSQAVATKAMRLQGFMVRKVVKADGSIQLVATK